VEEVGVALFGAIRWSWRSTSVGDQRSISPLSDQFTGELCQASCRANRNSLILTRNAPVGGNKGVLRWVTSASCRRDHENAFTSLAPLEPRTTVPRRIPR